MIPALHTFLHLDLYKQRQHNRVDYQSESITHSYKLRPRDVLYRFNHSKTSNITISPIQHRWPWPLAVPHWCPPACVQVWLWTQKCTFWVTYWTQIYAYLILSKHLLGDGTKHGWVWHFGTENSYFAVWFSRPPQAQVTSQLTELWVNYLHAVHEWGTAAWNEFPIVSVNLVFGQSRLYAAAHHPQIFSHFFFFNPEKRALDTPHFSVTHVHLLEKVTYFLSCIFIKKDLISIITWLEKKFWWLLLEYNFFLKLIT